MNDETVDTTMELVGTTEVSVVEGDMDVVIELVGCGTEVVLMETVELSTAEEVTTTREDCGINTELELGTGVVVVKG